MRTLSAALTTAQKSASASPYVRVRAIRKIGGVGRLDWSLAPLSGSETDLSHGATQPADGSLIRVRRTSGDLIARQRVAAPDTGSEFWDWPAGGGPGTRAVAVCSSGATAWSFYADATGRVYASVSSDSGATWGTWVEIAGAGTAATVLAAAMKPNGDVLVIFDRGATLSRVKRSAGAWGVEGAYPNMVATLTGLAAFYFNDYNLIITGTETATTHPTVWSCIYGDGYSYAVDTLGPLNIIQQASAGSAISYKAPSLAQPDVYRAFWVEAYTGSQSYTRSYFSHTPPAAEYVDNLWREPVPFNATYQQGLAITWGAGSYAWLSHPAGVWRAPLITGTGLDLTANVLLASIRLGSSFLIPNSSFAVVHLRNDNSAYATPGAGAIDALQRGSQLSVDFGYRTTTGNEVSAGPAYWIESLEHLATTGKAELAIRAEDGWGLLARWIARRQFVWATGALSIFGILRWIFARAGLDFSAILGGASPACVNLLPAFTIHPGTSGLSAVRALLAKVPDVIIFQGAAGAIWNPTAAQASTYSYGSAVTVHKIRESKFLISNYQFNHAQVFGTGVFNEDFSWPELELSYNRIAQVQDAGLTVAADALARSTAVLRDAVIAASHDVVITSPNVGQEVGDVIDVTESRANLTSAKRRVLELALDYQPAKAVYKQTLTLGAP